MSEVTPPTASVEAALEQLMRWPGLARSPQLAKFLNYIVQAKLRGDEASIKAYAIAVDVFGRPPTFDPQTDPIVRVQARRLRTALEEYYAAEGAGSDVIFNLPVGRYVPEIRFRDDNPAVDHVAATVEARPAPQSIGAIRRRPRRYDWLYFALVLIAGLGIAVVLMQVLTPRPPRMTVPQPPTVGISEFTAIAAPQGEGQGTTNIAGLAIELVTDLQLFDDIRPSYTHGGLPEGTAAPEYQLTGIARQEAGVIRVTASLRRNGSDAALWTYTRSVRADELESSIDDISRSFAEQLGSHRGPLFAAANKWLDENPNIAGSETEFLCNLLFTRYRDSHDVTEEARARDCVSSLLPRSTSALAIAIRAGLLLDDTVATQPLSLDPEPLSETERLLSQALQLDATSSSIWREQARYLNWVGRVGEAEAAYASALQLNPANLDAKAGYARMLLGRGNSEHGKALASEALQQALSPPHWYYAGPAINSLRSGDDAGAIQFADRLTGGDAELASVIATVAAFRSGNEDVLNRYFAQLLDVTRFRRFGILPVLRQRIPDRALVEEIAAQLKRAGVADEALNGSF